MYMYNGISACIGAGYMDAVPSEAHNKFQLPKKQAM